MPKRFSVTLSDDLYEAAEILRKRNKYRGLSEYFQGLTRYDGQSQREHFLTSEWAALSGEERDLLDKGILERVKKGEGVRGSWLIHRIEAIVEAYLLKHGKAPDPKEVAGRLARDIAQAP